MSAYFALHFMLNFVHFINIPMKQHWSTNFSYFVYYHYLDRNELIDEIIMYSYDYHLLQSSFVESFDFCDQSMALYYFNKYQNYKIKIHTKIWAIDN